VTLTKRLVVSPILTRVDFSQPFILDVDWSIRGIGAILSQKIERQKQVIAYASKGLFLVQNCFHPMEGECYALVWAIIISNNTYTKPFFS